MQQTLMSLGVIKKARVGDPSFPKGVATEEGPRCDGVAGHDDGSVAAVPVDGEVKLREVAAVESESPLFNLIHDNHWRHVLLPEVKKPYFGTLEKSVLAEYGTKKVFPPRDSLFAALNATPLQTVRVVILGQDPYHGPGQAMGLSFSVPRGIAVPSSLRNIYKELQSEIPGWRMPVHGDLTDWARRGVLLLNTSLSVRQGEANSHVAMGWHHLTDRIIQILSEQNQPIVFLLWGKHAQDRAAKMQKNNAHLVLKSPHPSGLSASKGFFGNNHFVKASEFLKTWDWSLPQ
jgi:uracil-DNA glycosylase